MRSRLQSISNQLIGDIHLAKQRNRKARLLISRLNKIRHEQAKKIDILCNDMVSAHTDFVNQLNVLNFSVGFYESLIGLKDLDAVLNKTVQKIQSAISHSSAAVYLLNSGKFHIHRTDESITDDAIPPLFESSFSHEIASEISRSRKISTMEDMIRSGLEVGPAVAGKLSAAAIPIGKINSSMGFILIYRSAENNLREDELKKAASITSGLCAALKSFAPRESVKNQVAADFNKE